MNKKICIFMPAYNAEQTVKLVWEKLPPELRKNTFLIDDHSSDNTFETAKKLGIESYQNPKNLGYGGNIKACLLLCLKKEGDIFVEMHPDNEYDPSSIEEAVAHITEKTGMILGNRFDKSVDSRRSGMYLWKYIPSKLLTTVDNWILGTKLTDLHQGFRIYTRQMLERVDFTNNADTYIFSFEIIAQTLFYGYQIAEIPVRTHYTGKKRGASLSHSITYTLQTFLVLSEFLLGRIGFPTRLFQKGRDTS